MNKHSNSDLDMIRFFSITVFLLLLTACMNVGNHFDIDKVSELVPGESTVSDAVALLGKPMSQSALPDGGSLVEWSYSTGSPLGGSAGQASIKFGLDGRMINVEHISSVD